MPESSNQELENGTFGDRLGEVADLYKSLNAAAGVAGVTSEQLRKWIRNRAKAPFLAVSDIALNVGVDPVWLATGKGSMLLADRDLEASAKSQFISIPRYDVKLSAGAGSFFDRAQVLDEIPFTTAFLKQKLRRSSVEGLAALEITGDSMLPTLADGDLGVFDCNITNAGDGIYAIAMGNELMVKRLQKLPDGGIMVRSDNENLYRPISLSEEDAAASLHIFGSLKWSSKMH